MLPRPGAVEGTLPVTAAEIQVLGLPEPQKSLREEWEGPGDSTTADTEPQVGHEHHLLPDSRWAVQGPHISRTGVLRRTFREG